MWTLFLQSLSEDFPHVFLAWLLGVVDQESGRLSVVSSASLVSNRLLLIGFLILLERHYLAKKRSGRVLFLIRFQFSESLE